MMHITRIMGPAFGPNYRGVINFHGIPVGVEVLAGQENPHSGKKVGVSYGDIPGTVGVDGQPIDVLLGDNFDSAVVFVLQDAHATDSDSPGEPKQYGEDKVALGFATEKEARKAHADYYSGDDRAIVGCLRTNVGDFRAWMRDPSNMSMPFSEGTLVKKAEVEAVLSAIMLGALVKGGNKPPKGFVRIKKSKHGGYRKPRPSGHGYVYWYPTSHTHADHPEWVRDQSKFGVDEIKAGHFIEVTGRQGMYVWTPDADDADSDEYTHVTPYDPEHKHAAGKPEMVLKRNVQPLKGQAPRPKRKKPESKAKVKVRRTAPPERKKPVAISEDATVSGEAEFAKVYQGSTAEEGTHLHRLENGFYPVIEFKDNHYRHRGRTKGVFIPRREQEGLAREFLPLMHQAARRVAVAYNIKMKDADGSETADFADVKAGAQLGFLLSLRSYSGGKPFRLVAQDYTTTYAMFAARSALQGGGPTIATSTMQLFHGYIAAKNRARKSAAEENEQNPTREAIARHWRLKKRDTLRTGSLGVYTNAKGEIVDQGNEEVPLDDWKVKGPDGKELGDDLPGKSQLSYTLDEALSGRVVYDSEWVSQNPGSLPKTMADPSIPAGTNLHLRAEIDDIMGELSSKDQEVLSAIFGLEKETEEPDWAAEYSRSGAGGGMTNEELSDRLGLAKKDAGRTTKWRAGKKARAEAYRAFMDVAIERKSEARKHARRWITSDESEPRPPDPNAKMYQELMERFGHDAAGVREIEREAASVAKKLGSLSGATRARQGRRLQGLRQRVESLKAERVKIYSAAVRGGREKEIGAILDREAAGTATVAEKRTARDFYHEQRDRDLVAKFKRFGEAQIVDREEVRALPPGTSSESDWLYTDTLLGGMMRVMIKHGSKGPPKPRRKPTIDPKHSKIMSEERFAQFMGRGQRAQAVGDNG